MIEIIIAASAGFTLGVFACCVLRMSSRQRADDVIISAMHHDHDIK